jgi:hypothetical protein
MEERLLTLLQPLRLAIVMTRILELRNKNNDDNTNLDNLRIRIDFGRIIFHTDDVDGLYSYLKNDNNTLKVISFENHP